jgi:hypothetical protein
MSVSPHAINRINPACGKDGPRHELGAALGSYAPMRTGVPTSVTE